MLVDFGKMPNKLRATYPSLPPPASTFMTMIATPYLLFLGDAPDPLAAKVAQGIRDWRPDYAIGQLRLQGCKADMRLPDMTIAEAVEAGVKTLVIGVANRGGIISESWKSVLKEALEAGLDLASGLHTLLRDEPELVALAEQRGLPLGAEAAAYLIPRAGRAFAEIEKLVAAIDRLSLERKVPPTQSIWRAALEAVHGPEEPRLL